MSVDSTSPLADPGQRLLARLIETLIGVTPGILGFGIGVGIESRAVIRAGLACSALTTLVVFVLSLLWLHGHGQSVGKRLLGLRIVRTDGRRAGLGRLLLLRELFPLLFFMIPWIGAGCYLLDRIVILGYTRRCVHDRLADTIVIDLTTNENPVSF